MRCGSLWKTEPFENARRNAELDRAQTRAVDRGVNPHRGWKHIKGDYLY